MKLSKRLQLLWLRLTECEYQVVKVTPKNVYRIRKYYKHLPNLKAKYHGYGTYAEEYNFLDFAQKLARLQQEKHQREIRRILDEINEKETPV